MEACCGLVHDGYKETVRQLDSTVESQTENLLIVCVLMNWYLHG